MSANDSLVMDATTAFLVMATATCTPCLFSGPDVAMEVSQSRVSSLGIGRPRCSTEMLSSRVAPSLVAMTS